jgi:hypothetical protein
MLNGVDILKSLQKVSGGESEEYAYQSGKIRRSSLNKGLKYYGMAIDKFLGNSLITRIMSSQFETIDQLRDALRPQTEFGVGDWIDLSGMIAPKDAVTSLLDDIQKGVLTDIESINKRLADIHSNYYEYEWTWAGKVIESYYGVNLETISAEQLKDLVIRWKSSVMGLDNLVYDDAGKEFSLSSMTSFGADGDENERKEDFMQVRGSIFEANPFVSSIREHIRVKSELGDAALDRLRDLQ